MSPGPTELIIVLVIILLLFGAKRLPGLAASLGRSIKEFRKGVADHDEDNTPPTPPSKPDDHEPE